MRVYRVYNARDPRAGTVHFEERKCDTGLGLEFRFGLGLAFGFGFGLAFGLALRFRFGFEGQC